jgi:hemerythrin superfamily protein
VAVADRGDDGGGGVAVRADEVLVEHHEVLRGLLRDLAATTGEQVEERRRLRDRFLLELEVHVQIEDEIFYPAVADVSPLLSIAHAEHRQIDDQLATVMRTSPRDPDFVTEVRMLANTLEHHASEEELRMFPQAHALGDDRLEELGRRLAGRRDELYASAPMRWMVRLKSATLRLV